MLRKIILTLSIALSLLTGWMFGYIKFPYIEDISAFWIGFFTSLSAVLVYCSFVYIWNGGDRIVPVSLQKSNQGKSRQVVLSVVVILAVGGLLFSFVQVNINEAYSAKLKEKETLLHDQAAKIVALEQKSLMPLVTNLLINVQKEIDQSEMKTLSRITLKRIKNLANSLTPQLTSTNGSSQSIFSFEMGQLFIGLCGIKMNSASFDRIKSEVSFSYADLPGVDLSKIDLSGVNLSNANLTNANLACTNMDGADLFRVDMSKSNLDSTNLSNCNLKHSTMIWSKLNDASLRNSNLDGANFSNAEMKKADLSNCSISYAILSGSKLNNANLDSVKLIGSVCFQTDFTQALFVNVELRGGEISHSVWENTLVSDNWLEVLSSSNAIGSESIILNHEILEDPNNIGLASSFSKVRKKR
jgi:uncharacterized protein YjbI with pentapeptide repeats